MTVSVCALILSLVALAVSVTTLVLARGEALRAEARLKQVISAPKYVGSSHDLKKVLVDLNPAPGAIYRPPQPVLPDPSRKR